MLSTSGRTAPRACSARSQRGTALAPVVPATWTVHSHCRTAGQAECSGRRAVTARVLTNKKSGPETSITDSVDETRGPEQEVDYASIDAHPLNQVVMALFRRKMVAAIGEDSSMQGYDGIIDLTRKLNNKYGSPRQTQVATVGILRSLFPSWLPALFKVMFAKPFPAFSNQMNAWATALTCQWLMGPNKVNDVELPDGKVLPAHGVKIERCRYLEQTGCVSVCVNSCKVPTQEFFEKDMGITVTLTPNYEDFSCQFSFGKEPLPQSQDDAFKSPCFAQCPSKRKRLDAPTCSQVVPTA